MTDDLIGDFMDLDKAIDWISVALTSLLFASFAIFEVIPGGRYVFVGLAGVVLLLRSRGKFFLDLNPYYIFNALLIAYAALSSLWAWDSSYALGMSKRMMDTFLCSVLIYMAYQEDKSPHLLTFSIKISGYIVMAYAIRYYGPRQLVNMLLEADRMTNEIGNVNVYGMSMAYSCVLELLEIVQKKKLTLTCPLVLPAFFVIAATQSRKSLLIVGLGIVLTAVCYGVDQKHIFLSIIRFAFIGLCAFIVLNILRNSPYFSGIMSRMDLITNYVNGGEGVGYSIRERSQLIKLGWDQFLRTPIVGIGFGNAPVLTALYNDIVYAYLHNNFIELLCCGGIIGFTVFYARYGYLLIRLIKNYKRRNDDFFTCIIIAVIIIIMDYGFVSYYSKMIQGFQVMMFLQVESLNRIQTAPVKNKAVELYRYIKDTEQNIF